MTEKYMPTIPQRTSFARRLALAVSVLTNLVLLPGNAPASELTTPAPVGGEGSRAYVLASLANVRSKPNASAPIITHAATNTAARIVAKQGDWCEVEMLKGENPASVANEIAAGTIFQQGFISCDLLSSKPITLAMASAALAKEKPNSKSAVDWQARAFWVAPSVSRWLAVGHAMEVAYLDEKTRYLEVEKQKPMRFKADVFEAMKRRLAAGIQVNPETIYSSGSVNPGDPTLIQNPALVSARQRSPFPVIKPSFFDRNNVPVILPADQYGLNDHVLVARLIDALSASNGVAFKAVATGSPSFALRNDPAPLAGNGEWRLVPVAGAMEVIIGVWDTGGLRVDFDKEVRLNGVTVRGEPIAQTIKHLEMTFGADGACSYSPTGINMHRQSLPGYAPANSALITWAGKPLPGGAATRAQTKTRELGGDNEYDRMVAHELDLDNDGVADFLVWQGRYRPQVSAEGIWTAVFANIGGRWQLLSYNEDADCT
jgi:hypothetical protein